MKVCSDPESCLSDSSKNMHIVSFERRRKSVRRRNLMKIANQALDQYLENKGSPKMTDEQSNWYFKKNGETIMEWNYWVATEQLLLDSASVIVC